MSTTPCEMMDYHDEYKENSPEKMEEDFNASLYEQEILMETRRKLLKYYRKREST